MASFAMLQAYSGFRYDMTRGMIGFRPVSGGNFRCFWSLGTVWGLYEREGAVQRIRILHGTAEFRSFALPAQSLKLNGNAVAATFRDGEWKTGELLSVKAKDTLEFL